MEKSLNILFLPTGGVGHINACLGIAQVMVGAGHRAIFLVDKQWTGKLVEYGVGEFSIDKYDDQDKYGDEIHSIKQRAQQHLKTGSISGISLIEKVGNFGKKFGMKMDTAIILDKLLIKILPDIKPDLFVLDQFVMIPQVVLSGIPYVWVWSSNPLKILDDPNLPPLGSGLSVNSDPAEWQNHRAVRDKSLHEVWIKFNEYVVSRGCPPLELNTFTNTTKCLNVYGFPVELDYTYVRPLPKNIIQFDNLMRHPKPTQFELPEQLVSKPGKLVYFSLGSMGGADVVNMKRLVGILSKCKHKFIVSKGPLHTQFELSDYMWGQEWVP